MTPFTAFVERRSGERLRETPLRRRTAQVRLPFLGSNTSAVTRECRERRKTNDTGHDVAATMELNLDRFPTKFAMLMFLRAVLDNAETGNFGSQQPGYVDALKQAIDILERSPEPIEAIATLQGYRAYMARHTPSPLNGFVLGGLLTLQNNRGNLLSFPPPPAINFPQFHLPAWFSQAGNFQNRISKPFFPRRF